MSIEGYKSTDRETKETKEKLSQNVKIVKVLKSTYDSWTPGSNPNGFYSVEGIMFDDCVYQGIRDYLNLEVNPFLKGEKDLKHNLTARDLETLFRLTQNPIDLASFISLAEKIELSTDDIDKFYELIEAAAKRELLFTVVTQKTSEFEDVEKYSFRSGRTGEISYISDKIKKKVLRIAKKYNPSLKDKNSASFKMRIEAEENPQEFILDCIKQTPSDNAIKFIIALADGFIRSHREKLNKGEILQAIQDLDDKKYGDKPEMITRVSRIFD